VSTQRHEDYPEDEFDRAGRDRSPQGVHRSPRSVWRALLPVIAVVILAPLLAWGGITLLGGGNGGAQPSASQAATTPAAEPTQSAAPSEPPSETPSEAPATEPAAEPTPSPTPTPSAEPTKAAAVEYDAGIAVLNGAGTNGLAGQLVAKLSSEGFASGTAADYRARAPQTTTLYYNNAKLRPTAQQVGKILGISNLVESASATQSTDIAVVIRADYKG
jgi:hypothetical protein